MAYSPEIYEAARRNLLANFGQQSAMNAYERYLAQTRGMRPIEQAQQRAFGPTAAGGLGEVPKLTSSYGRRGLYGQGVRSDLYNQAINEYSRQRSRDLGYAQQDLEQLLRGYDLRGTGQRSEYERGLADLERDKARQIREDAQALLSLR